MRVTLEDVCEKGASNLKQSDVVSMTGEYPIYGAAGYIRNVDFYHQEKPYVAIVKDGAGIGRTTLHPAKSSVIGTMQYLLPKDNVLPEYLYYVVRHMHLEKYFTGATIPHIYFRDYKNEKFNLDSLDKQAEIVEILEKAESVILKRRQQLAELDNLIKARFVEMFGAYPLNPMGWKKGTIRDVVADVRYDANFKLTGFDSSSGIEFINSYNEENSLDITLTHAEKEQLLNLAQGNTLVLVLSLRRLSKKLATVEGLKTEFSNANAWKSLKSSLTKTPSNTYEVVAEFMYKDTFEHIEAIFGDHKELFYKILKVFAVIPNDSTDISTICLLTKEAYPDVEAVMDVLCNYLIIEKRETQYALNSFAEKYIVGRFLPDAEQYNSLSVEITSRQRDVRRSLEQLNEDIKNRPPLAKIMSDWQIITDIDRINAAKMYELYGEVKHECEISGRFRVTSSLEDALKRCEESERLTAHPFIKYQRARILQMIDNSRILEGNHADSIQKAFSDAIYSIKTIGQYASIAQTKSYAALLWIYGQHLADTHDYPNSIRYLEEGKISFEEQKLSDQQYYQCCTRLGTVYLDYYLEDRPNRVAYLRKARSIERMLSQNWYSLGKAHKHAVQLRTRLKDFGTY